MAAGVLLAVALVLLSGVPAGAEDFQGGGGLWTEYDLNPARTSLVATPPSFISGGIEVPLTGAATTAYVLTRDPGYAGALLGDLSGRKVTATIGVTVPAGATFAAFQPGSCPARPNVRLFFLTGDGSSFRVTDYWWSKMSLDLDRLVTGDAVLSAAMAPGDWIDYANRSGGSDTASAAAFTAASRDVRMIGVSFGGGCFLADGIGLRSGSGSGWFRLMDFSS